MQHPKLIFIVIFFIITICVLKSQAIDCGPGSNGSKVANTIVVDQSGSRNFKTIQEAINSIPANNDKWIKIQINPGTYVEQVLVPSDRTCIFLEGQSRSVTTISYNAPKNSSNSATFTSRAGNIVAKGITFKNSLNHPSSQDIYKKNIKFGSNIPGVVPALAAKFGGDKSAFLDCAFIGVQDTLWDDAGRHLYSNCYIEGAVDFICGEGQSFFEDCSINATMSGFITAQGRAKPNDTNGFVFYHSKVSGVQGVQTLLGRAYGPYATVIFHLIDFSEVVDPRGWDAWHYNGQESNFTFAEVHCKGPGSDRSKRVPWEKNLNATELQKFSKSSFIDQDGWLAKLPL